MLFFLKSCISYWNLGNLKATYITEDFVAKEFTKGLSKELTQALKSLVEKE